MRERLIELIKEVKYTPFKDGGCLDVRVEHQLPEHAFEAIADHLLAEGVTVPPKKTYQEKLWEKNEERLRYGEFGSLYGEECYYTLLRFWEAQEQAGYPYASDNVKCFELMIAERSK